MLKHQSNFGRNGGSRPRTGKPAASHKSSAIAVLSKRIGNLEKVIETKYVDEINNFTPSTTGQSFCLNNFAQGDTVSTRNGAKTFMEHLDLRYYVQTNAGLVGPVNLRVMIVEDASPNTQAVNLGVSGTSTPLGPNGVIDNTVITSPTHLMPISYENKARYKILYDHTHNLNPFSTDSATITGNLSATATETGTAVLNKQEFVHVTLPIKSKAVYNDGSANIVSLLKGSLVALCFSDQSGNLPFVVMSTRLFFKDA